MATGQRARLALIWDAQFGQYDFGEDHPFSERSRAAAVRLAHAAVGQPPPWTTVDRVAIAREPELRRFHRAEYIGRVRAAAELPAHTRMLDRADTPAFPGCHTAAARIVGGALHGLQELRTGRVDRSFHPAGGLHHARADGASGFCIYNDVAVAIATALEHDRVARVAYIDVDAHHGDGVMYGFYADGRLLDIDFHQDGRTLFPGTGSEGEVGTGDGAGLKVNLPLPPGAGDPEAIELFERVVPPLLESFDPELIVLQHGVDGHLGDPLAGLRYTERFYARVRAGLAGRQRTGRPVPLLVTGGGGYAAATVARCLARCALDLAACPPGAELPAAWRSEFSVEFGEPAPEHWEEPTAAVGTATPQTDRIIGRLETALGRRFPSLPG